MIRTSKPSVDSSFDRTVDRTKVDAAIVTFNNAAHIRACLSSLLRECSEHVELVPHVVDNCSVDNTTGIIAEEFPDVDLVQSDTNAGFAKSNNRIIRETNAEYVLLINPDTVVSPGAIGLLLQQFSDPKVGMVGCRLVREDGSFDHASKRSIPTVTSAFRYLFGRRRSRTSEYLAPSLDEFDVGDVEAINGAFMLLRRETVNEVGVLDEDFWMYGEDLDWCLRIRKAGWKIIYDGQVSVTHLKGASTEGRRPPALNREFHRSMAIFYEKHNLGSPIAERLIVRAGIACHLGMTTLAEFISRRKSY